VSDVLKKRLKVPPAMTEKCLPYRPIVRSLPSWVIARICKPVGNLPTAMTSIDC
jgi:hypothetical protein